MNRMVRWLEKNLENPNSKIIDLGCGNGVLSIELYEAGFRNVHGVDYSANAIELARKLAEDSGLSDQEIQFSVSNFGWTFHPNSR